MGTTNFKIRSFSDKKLKTFTSVNLKITVLFYVNHSKIVTN